jgi:hypothetical protein
LGSRPGHIQYGNFLFGPGTRFKWDALEGWEDSPAIDSGTVMRASDHGAWPGVHYAQSRTITLSTIIKTEPGQMTAAVRELNAACTIDLMDEIPLVVQLDDDAPEVVFARCTRRTTTVTRTNRVGYTKGSIQFLATDPRRYSLAENSASAHLPEQEAGLSWPLAFPLAWGETGSSGSLSATNEGDTGTHPTITIKGPCSTPSVTNVNTGDLLEYDLTLSDTDTLFIDTNAGTVTLNGTQANRLYTATTRSTPEGSFVFPPGSSSLSFRSTDSPPDPASTLTVTWRSAFW